MRNLTVRQRIIGSFAIVLALMITVSAITYWKLAQIERDIASLQKDSMPGVIDAEVISGDTRTSFALMFEYIIAANKTERDSIEQALQANRANLESHVKGYESTISQVPDRENFQAFSSLLGQFENQLDKILKLASADDDQQALSLVRGDLTSTFTKLQSAIQVVVDFNKANADISSQTILAAGAAAEIGLTFSLVTALLLAIACGYYLYKAITRPLHQLLSVVEVMRLGDFTQRLRMDRRDEFGTLAQGFDRMTDDLTALVGQVQTSGIRVNTSITQIAATFKEQQATAAEISATTTEVGATSKEISATSKELVKTMNEVSRVAEQTATLAGGGQTSLSRMEETMQGLTEATGSINAKLAVLNEKAGNINQVVTTIAKVADQTNLLSLNAAIEAEKAGEYGRGFAVVATEIRRLADQTAVATYDIEQMVKEIQSAVSAGVMGMDKFSEEVRRSMHDVQQVGGQLSQIIQQVQALAPRIEAVNEGMHAQATGAEQISTALVQLSEAAHQTVESLRQSSLNMDEMNQVSSTLRESVSGFKLRA